MGISIKYDYDKLSKTTTMDIMSQLRTYSWICRRLQYKNVYNHGYKYMYNNK